MDVNSKFLVTLTRVWPIQKDFETDSSDILKSTAYILNKHRYRTDILEREIEFNLISGLTGHLGTHKLEGAKIVRSGKFLIHQKSFSEIEITCKVHAGPLYFMAAAFGMASLLVGFLSVDWKWRVGFILFGVLLAFFVYRLGTENCRIKCQQLMNDIIKNVGHN